MAANAYKMCGVSVLPKVLMVNSNFWRESTCTFKVFQDFSIFRIKSSSMMGKLQLNKNTWKLFAFFQTDKKQKMHNIIFIVKYTLKMVVLILGLTSSTNDFSPIYIYLGTFRVW